MRRPRFTKHYGLGLLVGTGSGLLLARALVGVGAWDIGADNWGLVGFVAMMSVVVGGILYTRDVSRPVADGGRAEPGAAVDPPKAAGH